MELNHQMIAEQVSQLTQNITAVSATASMLMNHHNAVVQSMSDLFEDHQNLTRMVAEKDREIAELKEKLSAAEDALRNQPEIPVIDGELHG